MEEVRICIDFGQRIGQKQFRRDGRFAHFVELRFEQAHGVSNSFIHVHANKLRRGHLREIAEAANNGIEIGKLRFQRGRGLVKDFQKLFRVQFPRLLQIFDGDLHREKRIAQLMREPSRQFAPGGNALGLHQAFFLRRQRLRHFIESCGKLADFITSVHVDARIPSSAGNFARGRGKFLDRPGDSRGNPERDQQSDE